MFSPFPLRCWLHIEFVFLFSNERDSSLFYHVWNTSSFYCDSWCQIYRMSSFPRISLFLDLLFHCTGLFHCFKQGHVLSRFSHVRLCNLTDCSLPGYNDICPWDSSGTGILLKLNLFLLIKRNCVLFSVGKTMANSCSGDKNTGKKRKKAIFEQPLPFRHQIMTKSAAVVWELLMSKFSTKMSLIFVCIHFPKMSTLGRG